MVLNWGPLLTWLLAGVYNACLAMCLAVRWSCKCVKPPPVIGVINAIFLEIISSCSCSYTPLHSYCFSSSRAIERLVWKKLQSQTCCTQTNTVKLSCFSPLSKWLYMFSNYSLGWKYCNSLIVWFTWKVLDVICVCQEVRFIRRKFQYNQVRNKYSCKFIYGLSPLVSEDFNFFTNSLYNL